MKVLIIGSTHAGVAATQQILKEHPETDVTIYERHDNVSFLSCGVSLYLGGQVKRLEDMFYSSPEELTSMGANVKTNNDVLKIDSDANTVTVENLLTKQVFTDHYDKLIMATGSYVSVPPLFGIDNSRVLLCKDYAQAQAIFETAKHNHHITIIGGGYVGVELAESYARTNHEVTLIQGNKQLLNNYVDQDLSNRVTELLENQGVHIYLNERAKAFYNDEATSQIKIETSGESHTADLVIVATGFLANTSLLRDQVYMDRTGALLVNEYMQTSNPDIYTTGDASSVHFNPTGQSAYMPLATNAVRQGVLAGRNIFGNIQKYIGTQSTSAMQIFDYTLASSGLNLNQAQKAGLNADSVTYDGFYRPEYMPSTEKIKIVLVYDKDTRRVLGAQLFSKHEIAQSANTISVIIQNQNTIDDLAYIDMLFQPNYDYPFNYLNLVAQMAIDKESNTNS
ncbi:FAD-dependent oxidoreductase [Pediococcus argentinicus]|uniref:FAD-dependent oxidoreductase n=1 Tax=Pediococcus argentinicus TaxID=480391 RepID=UPI0033902751